MADHVRIDFQQVAKARQQVVTQANAVAELNKTLVAETTAIQKSHWEGEAAEAFVREAEQEALPTLAALATALTRADQVLAEIARVFRDHDQDATSSQTASGLAAAPAGPGPTDVDGRTAAPDAKDRGQAENEGWSLLSILSAGWAPISLAEAYGKLLPGRETASMTARIVEKILPGSGNVAKALAANRWLGAASKGLSGLSFVTSGATFFEDPGIESGADFGASAIGLYGTLGSGPLAPFAAAFSVGYTIGDVLVPDSVKDWAGDRLTDWDPLDLQNSAVNYPRTTINDYKRYGREMPLGVAHDVFVGLTNEWGIEEANSFLLDYTDKQGISVDKFRSGLPWWHAAASQAEGFRLIDVMKQEGRPWTNR